MAQVKPPTTILDLEIEILTAIFSQVCTDAPRTASALALVSKYFNEAAKLVRYQHAALQWNGDNECFTTPTGLLPKSWKTPELLRGLRHLKISRWDGSMKGPRVKATAQLNELLCQVTNLRTLIWDSSLLLPASVLRTLETRHPRAHLKVLRIKEREPTKEQFDAEDALAKSPSLVSFGALIGDSEWNKEDHVAFSKIISGAPNIKFASLISYTVYPEAVSEWQEEASQVDRKPNASLRHLTLDGWALSEQTLKHWSRFVDLTALESFKCSRGSLSASYFPLAAQMMTNLKHVSLNLSSWRCPPATARAVQEYIDTCPPLSSLSLWSWKNKASLASILTRHGPTLVGLDLHEREDPIDILRRESFSREDLEQIRNSCPNLKAFTMDLLRQNQFLEIKDYQDQLDELEKAKLDKLQLCFDSGMVYITAMVALEHEYDGFPPRDLAPSNELPNSCGGDFDSRGLLPLYWDFSLGVVTHLGPSGPALSKSQILHPPSSIDDICRFVGEVWKHLFGSRTNGERLLEVKFGEWETKAFVAETRYNGDEQKDIRVYCRAKPHERDDKVGECQVLVQCCRGKHWKRFASG
ncbi:hypothetical protein A1O3_03668 [Capronia epimyces CBS 606.96]|uniref:Uncharacterized protein n=1 Tax=Capronia epimyces CBS 606.96 TaxID=1182542 RepID=W9YAN1_9EURO|nr:uncharacterized protein A1O3_03668 [Capronia epimyces CBS 606.96]EXJ86715.1 hypothetical protein A1O3_03668 [Capronia epimyces CBS 606.96]